MILLRSSNFLTVGMILDLLDENEKSEVSYWELGPSWDTSLFFYDLVSLGYVILCKRIS